MAMNADQRKWRQIHSDLLFSFFRREVLGEDKALLATVLGRLTETSSLLEAQEAQIAKLKEQLQAAQDVAINNRPTTRKKAKPANKKPDTANRLASRAGVSGEIKWSARKLLRRRLPTGQEKPRQDRPTKKQPTTKKCNRLASRAGVSSEIKMERPETPAGEATHQPNKKRQNGQPANPQTGQTANLQTVQPANQPGNPPTNQPP